MTNCPTPRPATTPALWLAVLLFAARRGFTPQLLRYRKSVAAYAFLSVLCWVCGLFLSWGSPVSLVGWLLLPFAIIVAGGLLGVLLTVAASEAWYYAPAPGKRSMLMIWPRWRILSPDKRIAGNWVAEPRNEGVGGTLLRAVIADVDRRGIWLYGTAATDELLAFYLDNGCQRRNDQRGLVRKPRMPSSSH